MGLTMPVYDRNASNFGQYIGGNLSRFDTDYIFLKRLGLTVGISPEKVFEKQGQCAFYMNQGHEFVPVRGTIIAPLFIPNPGPLKILPLVTRIQLMSKKQIVDQMKDNLGGNLAGRSVTLEKGISYGLITPEQKLLVMHVGNLGEYDGTGVMPLGDSDAGGLTGFMASCVAEIVTQCHSRGEEFRLIHNGKVKTNGVVNNAVVEIDDNGKMYPTIM